MAYKNSVITKDLKYYKDLIYFYLPNTPNGTSSAKIANVAGISSRDVRFVIQIMRDEGIPICGTPKDGYWIAQTSWDMNDTLIKLKAHIKNSIDTYNSLVESQNALKRKEGNNEYTELLV